MKLIWFPLSLINVKSIVDLPATDGHPPSTVGVETFGMADGGTTIPRVAVLAHITTVMMTTTDVIIVQ